MIITKQFLFDAAWNGLKAQGWQKTGSWNKDCVPAVRGCLQCANTFALHAAERTGSYGLSDFMHFDHEFRGGLIDCHDMARSPADMERRLREFAKAERLTIPGDGFDRFMAKVREPVQFCPVNNHGEWA